MEEVEHASSASHGAPPFHIDCVILSTQTPASARRASTRAPRPAWFCPESTPSLLSPSRSSAGRPSEVSCSSRTEDSRRRRSPVSAASSDCCSCRYRWSEVLERSFSRKRLAIESTMWSSPGWYFSSMPEKLCSRSNSASHPSAWLARKPNRVSARSSSPRRLRLEMYSRRRRSSSASASSRSFTPQSPSSSEVREATSLICDSFSLRSQLTSRWSAMNLLLTFSR
mmetsp:Transcript_16867/g.54557  ORF Transcript_16867/g.54557 Transcript_16867/m.54557 type:complete len:226 (-) Transcript_16867:709-1386(-)